MSQVDSGNPTFTRQKPTGNVYTVLVAASFVALTFAVALMWAKNLKLTEGERPADQLFLTAPFYVIPVK